MQEELNEVSAKEVRRLYFKEWRKNNPDKVKQYNANYWEKRAQKISEKLEVKNDNKN